MHLNIPLAGLLGNVGGCVPFKCLRRELYKACQWTNRRGLHLSRNLPKIQQQTGQINAPKSATFFFREQQRPRVLLLNSRSCWTRPWAHLSSTCRGWLSWQKSDRHRPPNSETTKNFKEKGDPWQTCVRNEETHGFFNTNEATTGDVRHAVPFTNSVPLHPFLRPHLWRWHAGSCGLHRLKMRVKGESTARISDFRFHLSSRSVIQTFHSWKLGSFGGIQLRNWYISYGEIYIYIYI